MAPFKSTIVGWRGSMQTKGDTTTIKTSLFDVPGDFMKQAGFDSFYFPKRDQAMSFDHYAQNRSNFEFLKEFNQLNELKPHLTLRNSRTMDTI